MSRTEPEMEERNRLRERKATERRRDIPRSGGREKRTQTIFRGKKKKKAPDFCCTQRKKELPLNTVNPDR